MRGDDRNSGGGRRLRRRSVPRNPAHRARPLSPRSTPRIAAHTVTVAAGSAPRSSTRRRSLPHRRRSPLPAPAPSPFARARVLRESGDVVRRTAVALRPRSPCPPPSVPAIASPTPTPPSRPLHAPKKRPQGGSRSFRAEFKGLLAAVLPYAEAANPRRRTKGFSSCHTRGTRGLS